MILVDSSAWIEFLRDTGSPVCEETARLLDSDIATTEPVRMEVLAGARDERHLRDLRALLGRARILPCQAADFESAAMLHRTCRRQGQSIRRLIDCLIASVAIRSRVPILHADADFEALARHTELAIHRPER